MPFKTTATRSAVAALMLPTLVAAAEEKGIKDTLRDRGVSDCALAMEVKAQNTGQHLLQTDDWNPNESLIDVFELQRLESHSNNKHPNTHIQVGMSPSPDNSYCRYVRVDTVVQPSSCTDLVNKGFYSNYQVEGSWNDETIVLSGTEAGYMTKTIILSPVLRGDACMQTTREVDVIFNNQRR